MELKQRLPQMLRAVPVAHRVVIAAVAVVVVLLGVLFVRWVTAPSYTVLYSGLDDVGVAAAVEQLETLGVPYRIEAGGSRLLVPRDQLYATRASLAAAGVGGASAPQGYELLDGQGLSVSDFRQRVDYQRALEGELARTLMAMDSIASATVRLVLPEQELFTEEQQPVTASVLVDTRRPLTPDEVETITFLVSSSVEGLEPTDITVANVDGQVLAAPGEGAGAVGAISRTQRQTHAFEQQLAAEVQQLLAAAAGGEPRSSVVVRATLNFDERVIETERYEPDSAVALKEQTVTETYTGTGAPPGGAVGIDGGPLPVEGSDTQYERDEAVREVGVNREVTRTVAAPGQVERLSVAIVTDDGSLTGADVPAPDEVEQLVTAALGLDTARGDTVAVTALPFPAGDDAADEQPARGLLDRLPQVVALVVLVGVAAALLLMTRRRGRYGAEVTGTAPLPPVAGAVPAGEPGALASIGGPESEQQLSVREQLTSSVTQLVEQQPEEIALLLRSWLADRR